jgi:hypothetical protein
MKQRCQELMSRGDRLFSERQPVLALWQAIAEQFYPERADFTASRSVGEEFASHLMTGLPSLVRRDLANQISAMLRPRGKDWFAVEPADVTLSRDQRIKVWFEQKSAIMRRAMYDTRSGLVRATKVGDHDFVTFGQAVITVEMDRAGQRLVYRDWHPRDVAWSEDHAREIDEIHQKWRPTARDLKRLFPSSVHPSVAKAAEKEPQRPIDCRRIIVPHEQAEEGRFRFLSLHIDVENQQLMEEVPLVEHPFIIPRWQCIGSQYAHSPCTVIGLADARTLQQMTLTLFEAGEKAVNPPLVATQEMVRSDINAFAGGVTWVDSDYDERLGEVLRPLTQDRGGLAFGLDMLQRLSDMLKEAFYLNKIMLPPVGEAMTATEVRLRTEEYIRAALPLFEPLETDYNGALCEKTWSLLLREGAFGNLASDMPEALRGREIRFAFSTPLQAAEEREKASAFQEIAGLLAAAAQVDPKAALDLDTRQAFRDAAGAVASSAEWLKPRDEADAARAAAEEAEKVSALAGMVGKGAEVAKGVGEAVGVWKGV